VIASRMTRRTAAAWQRARRRHGWLDHLARAVARYDEVDGGRLAAAITYYAFFATFALALLGYAAFGFILDDPAVFDMVQRYAAQNLLNLDVQALRTARSTVGMIALLGLPVTGWFWIDAMRSSIRKMWQLPEYPGTIMVRLLIDLLVLIGLGFLLVVSLTTAFVTVAVANRLIVLTGTDAAEGQSTLAAIGFVVGIAVNTLLSAAVLTGLPRLRMPLRRVIVPALLVAAGVELLKTVGRIYVEHVEANPTYQLVAGTVGLLISLNIINQLVLFAAALTATSTSGEVTDLSAQTGSPKSTGAQNPGPAQPNLVSDARPVGHRTDRGSPARRRN
jgi:membrane protein